MAATYEHLKAHGYEMSTDAVFSERRVRVVIMHAGKQVCEAIGHATDDTYPAMQAKIDYLAAECIALAWKHYQQTLTVIVDIGVDSE
jgi:hypothetical protein